MQEQFALISNTMILLVPDIPAQDNPWNNEYTVSVSTHYTEHGSLRTGIYNEKLRSPLAVVLGAPDATNGILTGRAVNPYVTVSGGSVSGTARIRIQVILDQQTGELFFNLLDMKEDGQAGPTVSVAENGDVTCPDSAVRM